MSAKPAADRPQKVEAQPLKALPMPEYGYQRDSSIASVSPVHLRPSDKSTLKNLDLSGIVLNLA